jgi:multidrug efflux pump subunit AcrB
MNAQCYFLRDEMRQLYIMILMTPLVLFNAIPLVLCVALLLSLSLSLSLLTATTTLLLQHTRKVIFQNRKTTTLTIHYIIYNHTCPQHMRAGIHTFIKLID